MSDGGRKEEPPKWANRLVSEDERTADRLQGEAFVVRGGIMESERLLLNATDVRDDEDVGEWAVCAAADPTMSPAEIAECAGFGHKQMMVSRVETLRSSGFEVIPDPDEGPVHVLITLPVESSQEPSEEEWEEVWETLRGCFGAPIRNPARR